MLPEVEEYFKATEEISRLFNEERRSGKGTYNEHAQKFENDRKAAWNKLGVTTSNPFIKWLCTDDRIVRSFAGHAETVFKNLPMTLSELDNLANEHDWCGDYDEMRAKAIEAGVLEVNYRVQMRYPGNDWAPFRAFRANGGLVTNKQVGDLLMKGFNQITFETNDGGVYFVRFDPENGSLYRRRR